MANTTKQEAYELVLKALHAGATLQSPCPKGHITCGPIHEATRAPRFGCYLYTRLNPAGAEIGWSCQAFDAAHTFVEYCGRGTAGKVARKWLEENV